MSPNQSGIALVTVLVFLLVIAAVVALRGGEELGEIHLAAADAEVRRLGYVAQAGMQRALWQARETACTGDFTIPATALGADTYSASTTGGGANTMYTLLPNQDAWIRSDNPAGTGDGRQHVRSEGSNLERALFRFDLSTLPSPAQVKSAVAWFYLEGGKEHPEGSITVHRVTADWTESDATWDGLSDKSAAAILATIPAQPVGDVWVPVNLTAQVQAWVNGQPNYGIVLGSTAEGIHAEYQSRESGGTSPRLEVVVGSGAASPLNIQATGTLDNGVTHTLNRPIATAYQPPGAVTLQLGVDPGEDTLLDSFYSARNYGGAGYLQVHDNGTDWQQYPLIRFELGRVPWGASVRSAQLELRLANLNAPGTATVHQVTRSWVEGTQSGGGQAEGATWFTHDGSNNWASAGGDINAAVVAETAIDGSETWVSWEIAPLVQRWLAGEPNYGLMIRPDSALKQADFESKEDSNVGVAPKLKITYACECGSACLAPQGAGKVLMVVGNAASLGPGDQLIQSMLEAWGYSVSLISDDAEQSTFSSQFVAHDVLFVSASVSASALGTKVSAAPIGVVSAVGALNEELGIATGLGTPVGDRLDVVDNDHYITRLFPAAPLQFKTAATELASVSGTVSPDARVLAEVGGEGSLVALDAGGLSASGGNVPGRRVLVPAGDANVSWNYLTNSGQLVIQRAIAWAMSADDTHMGNLLLVVVDSSNLTVQEDAKKTQIETWGYTVELIDVDDSQANFDAAVANNDVAFITEDISSSALGTKLVNAAIGVVTEEDNLSDEFGISDGINWITGTTLNIDDNGHYITSPFSLGPLAVLHISESLADVTGTLAPELQMLGSTTGGPALVVIDAGGTLVGGVPAAGRRVQLPWGGNNMQLNYLTADGLTIFERALEWGATRGMLSGPLAHWKLDETSGTTAVDSVGGHDGTLANGPVWTTGQLDGGLGFDGVDDTVDAGSAAAIDDVFAGGGTLAGWIYPRGWGGGAFGRIADKADALGTNRNGWAFEVYGSPRALLFQHGFSGAIGNWYTPTDSIVLDTWQHVAVVYDNSSDSNDPVIYVDGVAQPLTELDTPSGTPSSDAAVNFTIGNYAMATSRTFDGVLDDIRLYGRTLSAAEIAELAVPPAPGPIAHWTLDETSGTTAVDSVGGNDGTLNNGPVWTAGTIDGGLDFDGSNDYVVTNSSFTPPPAGTVTFWMKVSGSPAAHGRILGLHNAWEIRHVTMGTSEGIPYGLVFDLGVSGGNAEFVTTTTIDTPDNWYHIAASYDTATDAYAVYIDGVPHKSGTYSTGLLVPAANTLSLGTRTGSSNYYDGMLDDVRIYDQVLTPEQVADLAAQGGGGGGLTCTFRDEFDVQSYGNQDGDALWADDWQEINDDGSHMSGDVMLTGGGDPGNALRIQDDNKGVTRTADLGGHTSATLTLDYKRVGLESGEYVAVSVYDGNTWTEVAQFGNPPVGSDNEYQPYTQDISAYISPNFQIRLASPSGGMSNFDDVNFDNLQIEATGGATCP